MHEYLLEHIPSSLKKKVKCISFDRTGGWSTGPFASLNVSYYVGDKPEHVTMNRRKIQQALKVDRLVSARQVHGAEVAVVERPEDKELQGVDGLLTSRPGIGLLIQHADCQAVVLYDPVKNVIANLHCGWRGLVGGIIPKGIKKMKEVFGAKPEDLYAGISPALGPCCGEFRDYKKLLPAEMEQYQVKKRYFDFKAAAKDQLLRCSLLSEKIYVSAVCTVCSKDHFSFRRSPTTGRMGTVVALD